MVQSTDISRLDFSESKKALENWLQHVGKERKQSGLEVIRRAAEMTIAAHAGQKRASGEPYINHVFAVASILHELELDHEALAAALLHDVVEDTDVDIDQITREFGPSIAQLVDGVTKMDLIEEYIDQGRDRARESIRVESLRKMLLAMVEDVRVVLVKLADRLHNLRTLKHLTVDRQVAIAKETLDIYAPLANRLGVWQLKWELEDLALRYLEPDIYHQLASKLAEKRSDREQYIKHFTHTLVGKLNEVGVDGEVFGRPKHLYSIWNKMQRKALEFEQLYDIRAVRILVDSIQDCYAALGVVHTHWSHISGEFDDYIATPKENNYQSIHTAVIGPEGRVVEIQIRTHEMHEHNELGVAAHWRYKEGKHQDKDLDRKVVWLRQLLEWKDEVADANEFIDRIKDEVFEDRVYVFTPNGKVIDLSHGATPLDFAYAIHTEVGHHCRGAKVNGRMVPLTYTLKTGEQVEVITSKKGGPSRDWLSPHLGYIRTSRARSRIQHWFRQENSEVNIAEGRHILERELQRMAVSDIKLDKLARALKFKKVDELFLKLADGDIKPARVAAKALEMVSSPKTGDQQLEKLVSSSPGQKKRGTRSGDFTIQGVGNLLTNLANCCHPVPGDRIIGYITKGRGVTIHRRDCHHALYQQNHNPERLIEVGWDAQGDQTYPMDIMVSAYDRQGLLRDISEILADSQINVRAVNTLASNNDQIARISLSVEVANLDRLSLVLTRISQLPNVIEARRIGQ